MKKIILMLLGLSAATLSPAAEDRVFALATAGEVDPALAERVRVRMEESSGAVVRMAPPVAMEPGQTLEAIGRAAAKTRAATDFGIIVLARSEPSQPQGVCLPHEHFAILNISRLEAGADAARLERRAMQEGLRVMTMLLDMAPCPFPLCVLVGYEKTGDLDQMSGSYCPPCLERFERVARDAGLRMVEKPIPEPASEPEAAPAAEPAPAPAE